MSEHESESTPEQQAQVRRLLVDARHGEPIPVDVAARLERVLEQLAVEGPDAVDPVAPVIDLGARRRRRAAGLLAVAAAVVVVGVALGQVADPSVSGDESAPAAGADLAIPNESSAREEAGTSEVAPPTQLDAPRFDDQLEPRAPIRLTEKSFAEQVLRFQSVDALVSTTGDSFDGDTFNATASFMCDPANWGPGRLLPVLYDKIPAVLAYRFPTGDSQTVDLLRCGTGEILRSTVVPLP